MVAAYVPCFTAHVPTCHVLCGMSYGPLLCAISYAPCLLTDLGGTFRTLIMVMPRLSLAKFAGLAPQMSSEQRRAASVAGVAHALHDGYTDLIYLMLPLWQAEFGLTYAALGLLRSAFVGAMASLQIPAGYMSERFGAAIVLALGTALAGFGYCLAGLSTAFAMLLGALLLSGIGSSTQHPIASALVARAFAGASSLKAIGAYNFAGDLGKMTVPAMLSLMLLVTALASGIVHLGQFRHRGRRRDFIRRSAPRIRSCGDAIGPRRWETAAAGVRFVDRYRRDRQRDSNGFFVVFAVRAHAKRRDFANRRLGDDPYFCRRRRRQTGLRLYRCADRRNRNGVADRRFDRGGYSGAVPAAAAGRALRFAVDWRSVKRHVVGAVRFGSRSGRAAMAHAGAEYLLHRHYRRRRNRSGTVWPPRRPSRRMARFDAGSLVRAADVADCMAAAAAVSASLKR